MFKYPRCHFKWNGDSYECPDPKLLDKNYTFYAGCTFYNKNYEVGQGVSINLNNKSCIACIHYFYENTKTTVFAKRYQVALELFHNPIDILNDIIDPVDLNTDIEIIKQDKVQLKYVSVEVLKAPCVIVYGLDDENPIELLQEFSETTSHAIYVCRYIAGRKKDKYKLRGAVVNEIEISDDEESNSDSEIEILYDSNKSNREYVVTQLNEDENNIRIKLTRSEAKRISDTQKTVTVTGSPSELLGNLRLSDKQVTKTVDLSPATLIQRINLNVKDLDKPEMDKFDCTPLVVLQPISENTLQKFSPKKSNAVKDSNTPVQTSLRRRASCVESPPDIPVRRSLRLKVPKNYEDRLYSKNKVVQQPQKDESESRRPIRMKINKTNVEFLDTSLTKSVTPKVVEEDDSTTRRTRRKSMRMHELENDEIACSKLKRSVMAVDSGGELTPRKQAKVVNTPKSARIKLKNLTPMINERDEALVTCGTPMQRARAGLSAYNMPNKMPCREHEYSDIYRFVAGRIREQGSGCMYISGVPGTGKTMTVCKVMQDLSKRKDNGSIPDFIFLKLNALALTEPRQIYVEIIKNLLNKTLHWEESLNEIIKFFKAKKKKCAHVVLIDELDKLCNRKQDVIYNLLDLPFHSVTPLIVITIANTMDLPERILTNKVNSRLGLVRLTFKPYQHKDLVKIVTERLETEKIFKSEALELVARKVAAVSGDARRALALCSRATEIAEELSQDLITMEIVDKVVKEMISTSKVQAIKSCSKIQQLILTAVANEVTRTGNEEVPFLNMWDNLEKMCLLESVDTPSVDLCIRLCIYLGGFRLLLTQHGRTDVNMTLMLNISPDDIHFALN